MQYQGVLTKMQTEMGDPIQYYLIFESDFIHMNQLLGKSLSINFVGYQCLCCGKSKKIFRQGYCYDDFYNRPEVGDWIMRPELSTAHLDQEDRDLEYEKRVQLQPHIVYLANSSNIKVGVTRKTQVPTRWIDQGAHEAIELVEVPNRYLAGVTEVALKAHVADKTNWRKMLKNEVEDENLLEYKNRLKLEYPKKLKSLNLEKTNEFTGVLKGIKGQYLIFEDETVFNVRNNEGYVVELKIHS